MWIERKRRVMNQKIYKIMLGIVFLVVTLLVPQSVNAKSRKGINIEKTFASELKYQVKLTCDKNSNGYLSKSEIKKIWHLNVDNSDCNINLKGLSKLKYLKNISITTKSHIKNIKELTKLHRLKKVHIKTYSKENVVFDLRKIRKLQDLEVYAKHHNVIVKVRKNNIHKHHK